MPGIFDLIDACCEAYDNPEFVPKEGQTFCNRAVTYVAEKMGYFSFTGLLANQMVEFMRTNDLWEGIAMNQAQAQANKGRLVIAGIILEPHGHVVVIRPGVESYSPKWGCVVPKVMNIGAQNFIDKPLSWVMHDKPDVFALK